MSKKQYFALVFSFLFILNSHAQNKKDSLSIGIHLNWKKESLLLQKKYQSKTDSLKIETLKFYVSGIEIQYQDATNFIQENSYHLVDIEDQNSLIIPVCKASNKIISKVVFNIGVDSLASVSGALSGNLDPIKGMYWAWQSGYINMKIEGSSPSCIAERSGRKSSFQFHVGGYLQPNYAIRKVEIPITKNNILNNQIDLSVDLINFFSKINLKETNSIMIPGKEAMKIADLFVESFSTQ